MESVDELKQFLMACRARLTPDEVGLVVSHQHAGTGRRVKGLRREEVAQLAGVSVDYYARLEQGRTKQVSASVIRAVGDALRLNDTEREYFVALVAAPTTSHRPAPTLPVQRVRPGIHRLLASFMDAPAFVVGRGMQLLAMNKLAREVLFDAERLPAADRNLARWTFLNPDARSRYVDWDTVASDAAAILRVDTAANPNDRFLNELIGELTVKSDEFRRMWAEHKVYECTFGSKRLRHPLAGEFLVDYEALDVPGSSDQKMFVYTAAPGSASQEALNLIASWAASPDARVALPDGDVESSADQSRRARHGK